MSNKNPLHDNPVVEATTPVEPTPDVIKPSFAQKARTKISNNKKNLIAGAGLLTLVGVSAALGRKSASIDVDVYDGQLVVTDHDVVDEIEIDPTTD